MARIKQHALELPAVRNGLITPAYARYLMHWKDRVNRYSLPTTWLELTKGPDLITSLLATNAVRIDANDYLYNSEARDSMELALKTLLEMWTPDKRTFSDFNVARKSTDGFTDTETLYRLVRRRAEMGYYNVAYMHIGEWRILITELMLMGVPKSKVKVWTEGIGQQRITRMSFPWAYPGELPQVRTISFLGGRLEDFSKNFPPESLPKYDGLFQKSGQGHQGFESLDDPVLYRLTKILREYMKPKKYLLFGAPLDTGLNKYISISEVYRTAQVLQDLGFRSVEPDLKAEKILLRDPGRTNYGWQLFGFSR